jgi:erythromycin esterase-like protein
MIHALVDTERDHGPLLDLVGDAQFVLLGEASSTISGPRSPSV